MPLFHYSSTPKQLLAPKPSRTDKQFFPKKKSNAALKRKAITPLDPHKKSPIKKKSLKINYANPLKFF